MDKKPKLLIIDGHAMAFRAHYALITQRLVNSKNEPIETIFGFFKMIAKLIREFAPEYLCIAFDPPKKNFRYDIYPEYKQNRKETPLELKLQLDDILSITRHLDIPALVEDGFEADDVIASLVENLKDDFETFIVSGDKDLFSLLHGDVKMYRPVKGVSEFKVFSHNEVTEEIGVLPEQIVDYMALTGDTSDNVPGVAGVGPKTAAKLIREYDNLDKLYENIDKIKPEGVQKKLRENRENAFLSRKLVTLRNNIALKLKPENLQWSQKTGLNQKASIFRDKELPSLYEEWSHLSKAEADTPSTGPAKQYIDIKKNMITISGKSDWLKIYDDLMKLDILSVDTETTSVHPMEAKLVGVSLAWKVKNEYYSSYLPVVFDDKNERHFDYQNIPDGPEALEWVKPLLENPDIKKVGQNIKYDLLVLFNHGVHLSNIYADTMVISYLLDPNLRRHNMDDMAWRHLQYQTIKYKDITGSGKKEKALVQIPLEELALYAAEDAEITLRLFDTLHGQLEREKLSDLYGQIDGPMIELLATMEKNGILLDLAYMQKLESGFLDKMQKIENEIYSMAGEQFNIQSTRELQNILFQKMNLVSRKKTAKGNISTDANVLESIKNQHPIVEKILEHRSVSKLLNTYVSTLPHYINPKTGRIHTSFSQTIAATGRLASSDPNLQNIPIKEEEGRAIRKAFIPKPGFELLAFDYSQIELRILAHYCGDEHLIRAFQNNEDIHDQATYLLFNNQFDPDKKTWGSGTDIDLTSVGKLDMNILNAMKQTAEFRQKRSLAKILNFSIVYGVTEYGLSKNLSIPVEEARNLIHLYFANYPGIKKYMNDMVESTRETLYSGNWFGRKRKVEDIRSKNRFSREAAERLAINNPIQSTAADLIKVAMLRIQKKLEEEKLKTLMLLQIHDELLFEVPDEPEEKNYVFNMIKNEMENVVSFKVPLLVSGGFGKNWDETK